MTICARCRERTSSTIMSKFNTDVICFPCKDDEREAPGYKAADDAEIAAVRAGVRNFPGVGLSAKDTAFLQERLEARRLKALPTAEKVRLLGDPAYTTPTGCRNGCA